MDGSHVHYASIGQGGAQLYAGSIATPTPQAFSVASPPAVKPGYGVDETRRGGCRHALHPDPYPPDLSRFNAYGASHTGSLALRLLTLLDRPEPSGSSGSSRHCRGRFPPSPAFPGSGCPQLQPGRCDDLAEKVSRLHSIEPRLAAHLTVVEPAVEDIVEGADGNRRLGRQGDGLVGDVTGVSLALSLIHI